MYNCELYILQLIVCIVLYTYKYVGTYIIYTCTCLMRDEGEEASKVKQTTRQSNTTHMYVYKCVCVCVCVAELRSN